jgi:uncharacterized repeat protein (TIGR03803 family)
MTANLTTLFSGNGFEASGVIADANGDLFGTTVDEGADDAGTVFEIAKTPTGYASTPTLVASFTGESSSGPVASLIADSNGDLFGTTEGGGADNAGTVFAIAKTAGGYASTPATLAAFNSADGFSIEGGLIADSNGDLFGTTSGGGAFDGGTVFEIAKTAIGYASTPITLASFNGSPITGPAAGLVADADGDLFGTTKGSGADDDGTVFEIAKTANGYASTPITLVSFNGVDGSDPMAGLIVDTNGDLFGSTTGVDLDGNPIADGTVFEIKKTAAGYASTPTTLVNFNGTNGELPTDSLIADLFGTTKGGGTNGDGTVFEIAKTADGYTSAPITLVNFNGVDGIAPEASLIPDANGDLFGTTTPAGQFDDGTVFEVTGSGFVPGPRW